MAGRRIGAFEYDKEKSGFKHWLSRIPHRKVVDLLRKRREPVADSQDIRALRDPGPTPDKI